MSRNRPRRRYDSASCTTGALSPDTLVPQQIVSAVKARARSGQGMDAAGRTVTAQTHRTSAVESTTVSVCSIYRWLADPIATSRQIPSRLSQRG